MCKRLGHASALRRCMTLRMCPRSGKQLLLCVIDDRKHRRRQQAHVVKTPLSELKIYTSLQQLGRELPAHLPADCTNLAVGGSAPSSCGSAEVHENGTASSSSPIVLSCTRYKESTATLRTTSCSTLEWTQLSVQQSQTVLGPAKSFTIWVLAASSGEFLRTQQMHHNARWTDGIVSRRFLHSVATFLGSPRF